MQDPVLAAANAMVIWRTFIIAKSFTVNFGFAQRLQSNAVVNAIQVSWNIRFLHMMWRNLKVLHICHVCDSLHTVQRCAFFLLSAMSQSLSDLEIR